MALIIHSLSTSTHTVLLTLGKHSQWGDTELPAAFRSLRGTFGKSLRFKRRFLPFPTQEAHTPNNRHQTTPSPSSILSKTTTFHCQATAASPNLWQIYVSTQSVGRCPTGRDHCRPVYHRTWWMPLSRRCTNTLLGTPPRYGHWAGTTMRRVLLYYHSVVV